MWDMVISFNNFNIMSLAGDVLNHSLQNRLDVFFRKLDNNFHKFSDIVLNGTLCKMPKRNQIPNKRYYQFRVRRPIGYETTTKYRIRLNNTIFDLYKSDNNFYFIDLPDQQVICDELYNEFCTRIQFSFIFYLTYTMLTEVQQTNKIYLTDLLFTGLTDKFHDPSGDFKITLTPFSVKNKIMTSDHLYISLFN